MKLFANLRIFLSKRTNVYRLFAVVGAMTFACVIAVMMSMPANTSTTTNPADFIDSAFRSITSIVSILVIYWIVFAGMSGLSNTHYHEVSNSDLIAYVQLSMVFGLLLIILGIWALILIVRNTRV